MIDVRSPLSSRPEAFPLTTADRARALAAFVKKCEVTKT